MSDELDDILREVGEKRGDISQSREFISDQGTASQIRDDRRNKVSSFTMSLDLDGEYGELPPPAPRSVPKPVPVPEPEPLPPFPEENAPPPPAEPAPEPEGQADFSESYVPPAYAAAAGGKRRKKKDPRAKTAWGCFRGFLYAILVFGVSIALAVTAILGGIDMTGLNKSGTAVSFTVSKSESTREIANGLKKAGLIDQPLFFIAYSRLTHKDGTYQPGTYSLTADMGYSDLIDAMQQGVPQESVRVTIPEGYTIDEIATALADNGVCTKDDFYKAVSQPSLYVKNYSFINDIPTKATDPKYADRAYALEGYLFPDTYDFYKNSTGQAAVDTFLDNFKNQLSPSLLIQISDSGLTLDQTITLASIVEGEAGDGEWSKVARVLENRLADPGTYPKLECDSTRSYVKYLNTAVLPGGKVNADAYDTYVCTGLPVGPICNPGMNAIKGVLTPSTDPKIMPCYYFYYDKATDTTYYSKTLSEQNSHIK